MINGLGCWILEVLTILFFQLICWLQLLLLCNPWFNCLMGNQPKLLTLALLFFLLHSLSLMFFVFLPLALTCYMLVLSHYLNLIVLFSSPLIFLSRTFYLGKRLGWARLLMACTCCNVIVSNTFPPSSFADYLINHKFNATFLPFSAITSTSSSSSYLWHARLGHPSDLKLRVLGHTIPSLQSSCNKNC